MTAALRTKQLTKRYGRRSALANATMEIPAGHVAGIVGPNGVGKTTLLRIAVGMQQPTSGTIEVLGRAPGSDAAQLARVGFVAQDTPTYASLSVADHLRFGAKMNPTWDAQLAATRIATLGLDPRQKAGKLSGGQRAQLALTLAIAKRPELLVLDEPVASLDPLARRQFLGTLMEYVAEHGASVILSSHLVSDLERVCDYMVVLTAATVHAAGDVDDLLASHYRIIGPRSEIERLRSGIEIIDESLTDRQATLVVRTANPHSLEGPSWTVEKLDLEDVVLAHMSQASATPHRALETQ